MYQTNNIYFENLNVADIINTQIHYKLNTHKNNNNQRSGITSCSKSLIYYNSNQKAIYCYS